MKKVKTHTKAIDVDDLPCEMPDLDALVDEGAAIDGRKMSKVFGVETFALCHRSQSSKVVTFDLRKVKAAVNCIKSLPAPGKYLHFVVGQEFAGFDLLPTMLQLSNAESFQRLYLTTLGFNRDNLAQMLLMLEAGQIDPKAFKILCSDFFRRADTGLWDLGKLQANEHGYGWRSFRNHTKIILAQIGDAFYVVESSANLRSCQNIEQFSMTRCRELFEFHAGWIESIWGKRQT